MSKVRPIRTQAEYEEALRRVDSLMNSPAGSAEADELDVLVLLVEKYEEDHFPMDLPDPIAVLRFVMDQRGLTAGDLAPYIGKRNRVYEILSGKRGLTLPMIVRLSEGLAIPVEALIPRRRPAA